MNRVHAGVFSAFLLVICSGQAMAVPSEGATTSRSFEDYEHVKEAAFGQYEAAHNKVFDTYEAAKAKYFDEYETFDHAELIKLRATAYQQYLQWLDAQKMGDLGRRALLERTVPALAHYVAATSARYEEYQAADGTAYKQYQDSDRALYQKYEAQDATAYAVYEARQK